MLFHVEQTFARRMTSNKRLFHVKQAFLGESDVEKTVFHVKQRNGVVILGCCRPENVCFT